MKKIALLPLILFFILAAPSHSQGDLFVVLETTPAPIDIGPDSTFVKTTLSIVDTSGQPVPDAFVNLHLDAPAGNAFISTDFPIVEGTPLFEFAGILPNGVLEFDYIYPIRGTYDFAVEAGRDASNVTYRDTLTLTLGENRNEIVNFGIFALLLLGLGVVAGFIIGRGARAQRMAVATLGVVFGLSLIAGSAFTVQAHGGGDVSNDAAFTEQSSAGDVTLSYTMNPGAGRVGTLNQVTLTAMDGNDQLIPNTTFDVALWHIEDDKPIFVTTLPAPGGEVNFDFQFFDGAEHEVRLMASTTAGTVDLSRVVEVEGLNPPFWVKVKTLVYLTVLVFIGILLGLRIQVRQAKKLEAISVGA